VSPIFDEAGRIVGASKIARDISERTRLLAEAREHAANAERLSAIGAVVASTLDRESVVQQVTNAGTALTHAEFGAFFYNVRDQKTGDAYMLYALSGAPKEAFSSFPHPRVTAVLAPTFHGTGVVRLDDVTEDPRYGKNPPFNGMPEGHLPVRSYLAVPVKGLSGDVLGGLFFGHSQPGVFTEQHERLAVGVAAWASVALENARLYLEVNTANRMKDDFLAVLSHELRTPLNAILGYARLLRGNMLPGDQVERAMETIERNARWLTQIIEDVLDVSRIVSGKIRLNVQTVELPAVVDNAVATVQPAAEAKGVRLQALVDPRVGPVAGDPDRLQQVVWNLLSNAVKFTPKGGRVEVRLARVDSHIETVVSDTGAGISADFLPYVFERFRQGDQGPTRKTGGLGLGLAIVRHLVEMHGGTVHAASHGEGQGAAFTVCLPLMAVRPDDRVPRREHPVAERKDPLRTLGDLSGVHVLAVDDEQDALGLLRDVLEIAGARVSTMSSARAALERIEELMPDVLVADIGMPEMDGYALIRQLRSSTVPAVRDIPAAALTAFARSDDRAKALQNGFEMHLSKPVDPGELVAAVASLVRRRRKESLGS
jgi:signal transduction histidine kinase/CheY-like chemotaxis protein